MVCKVFISLYLLFFIKKTTTLWKRYNIVVKVWGDLGSKVLVNNLVSVKTQFWVLRLQLCPCILSYNALSKWFEHNIIWTCVMGLLMTGSQDWVAPPPTKSVTLLGSQGFHLVSFSELCYSSAFLHSLSIMIHLNYRAPFLRAYSLLHPK